MINNNRQAGRRRGRGGQRQGGNPNSGNRIDNRARGNAAQLLEKYKTLAADAQRQGDRVNAEYYLQFADHYFRVLAESRSRFEEQNGQRRGREDGFDDDGDEGFDDDNVATADAEPRREREREREPREDRPYRDDNRQEGRQDGRQDRGNREFRNGGNRDRDDRGNRGQNGQANGNAYPANDGDDQAAAEAPGEAREVPRRGRPRRDARPVVASEGESFDASLLPPSLGIGIGDESGMGGEEAPKPRRGRPRRTPDAEAAE